MSRFEEPNRTPFNDTVQLVEVMPSDEFADGEQIIQSSSGYGQPSMTGHTGKEMESSISRRKAHITVVVLLFVNLLNYMDRFTIAGVLIDVRKYYHDLSNSEAGIIQTAFICTYMVFSPIFGYLGDRYTRKYIMAAGIFLWSALTLASSFIPPDYFWLFVLLRALVGIGEASYSTIAPTIIADLFAKEKRTKALMVFYFAIPVGSGLGYIVGSNVAAILHAWQWALRVTPALGMICVILIILLCQEPYRGMSEGNDVHLTNTSILVDIKALSKNKSFILSSVGFTCVAFVTGALAFLAPSFMFYAYRVQQDPQSQSTISLLFGGITVAAGFLGVAVGAEAARKYKRINPRSDPLICAFGLLTCVPFLFLAVFLSRYNIPGTWVLIFVGETMLCLNWAVTADILLYVVVPTRRSIAESGQILLSHALGDAISPYIIGQIADGIALRYEEPDRPFVQFFTMQTSLYLTTFVCVLGGAAYLATAIFIERDRNKAESITQGHLGGGGDLYDDELLIDGTEVNFVADEETLRPVNLQINQEVVVAGPASRGGDGDRIGQAMNSKSVVI